MYTDSVATRWKHLADRIDFWLGDVAIPLFLLAMSIGFMLGVLALALYGLVSAVQAVT